jgi:hypothetical protein
VERGLLRGASKTSNGVALRFASSDAAGAAVWTVDVCATSSDAVRERLMLLVAVMLY